MGQYLTFPALPLENTSEPAGQPRVCIATYEIVGPNRNGGIGTAYFSLANALAASGQKVTILYLRGNYCEQNSIQSWRSYFRHRNIQLIPLPRSGTPITASGNIAVSYNAYRFLRDKQFDVIHFPELLGHGYYSVLAKHQGLDFRDTTICVGTHSPTSWIRAMNREFLERWEELELDFMERQSVALADVVVSPSHYMIAWLQARGWRFPERTYVQQYILSPELQQYRLGESAGHSVNGVREIVFFGRLEERKGLAVFCDALDLLASTAPPDFEVTFMGKPWRINGRASVPYIHERAARWPFPWNIASDLGHSEGLEFLRRGNRVAVIPSLEDNLPNAVLECLCGGIPFVASRAGGIPELISQDDLENVTFAPNPHDLASRLSGVLTEGVRVARPAIDPDENRNQWIQWHRSLMSNPPARSATNCAVVEPVAPLVSVCLTHRGNANSLRPTLSSLEAQEWQNFEVIIAGASGSSANTLGDELGHLYARRACHIIDEPQFSQGAARNAEAMRAKGDFLLFMDDHCSANREAISTFVRTQSATSADVLTCFLNLLTQEGPDKRLQPALLLFLGAAVAPSLFYNHMGLGSIFSRRTAFHGIGGFAEDCHTTPDWEFLAKAALNGYRFEVVPRVMASQRTDSAILGANDYEDRMRNLRPYLNALPLDLRDILQLLLSMSFRADRTEVLDDSSRISDLDVLALTRELAATRHRRVASFLNAWLDYRVARSKMPPERWNRIPHIARQLVRGRYHRFAHGFGSALRDFRKPAGIRVPAIDSIHNKISEQGTPSRWASPLDSK